MPELSKMIVAVEPAGRETKIPARVTSLPSSSVLADVNPTALARAEPIRPVAGAAIVTAVTSAMSPSAALEGATDNIPKPKAATATSATRLKVVFVDICFLSISRSEEFPPVGFG
jgi:hypothetical protein